MIFNIIHTGKSIKDEIKDDPKISKYDNPIYIVFLRLI